MSEENNKKQFEKTIALLSFIIAFIVIYIGWNTPVFLPLKIMVVLFHEISHGIAAVLTGGEIVRIEVNAQQGGQCTTAGGSQFIILFAGYVGSAFWGCVLYLSAYFSKADKFIAGLLGLILLYVALFYVRPFISFDFTFCIMSGIALLIVSKFFKDNICDVIIKFIGLVSCLYAILDIKSDVFDRPDSPSDAFALAQLTGVPVFVWGTLWITISLVLCYFIFKITFTKKENNEDKFSAN